MEIAPGVHRVKCMFGNNRMVYVHLLVGSEAVMLVDTGCAHNPEQEILPYMESIGLAPERLTYIVISHSDMDHQGGNQPMKESAPQALLMGHNLDRPWLETTDALIEGRYSQFERDHGIGYSSETKAAIRAACLSWPLDMTLESGEVFRLGPDWHIEVLHTPGHSWGHLSIYDSQHRLLVAGEAGLWTAILGDNWEPALPPTYSYVDTYLATQERLMAMDIAIYTPSHWPVQEGSQVGEFLRESRNYCLHVAQKLLALAREHGAFTLQEAIDHLAPTLGRWPAEANQDLSYGMFGNLEHLTQRGLLTTGRNSNNRLTWSLAA